MSNLGFRKVKLSIRWILFFTLFAMSIIPILIITTYSQTDLTKNLEGITLNYQNSILKQINTNIDFIYEQYLMTLTNIFEKQEVIEGIDLEKFRDSAEEREVSRKIIGQYYKYRGGLGIEGGIREIAEKKIYGDIFIYEQDKASIIDKTPYKYYTPNPDIIPPNYEKLIADPLFQKIKSDNNIKIIIGKPREGVLTNYFQKDSTIIIFPFYYSDFYDNNRSSETFSDFILVILRKNFFEITFENITNFNQGTLYMLDINNNIIMQTHPSDNNYYEYDYEQKKYISTEKEKSEEQYDKVDFSDYKYLNTDSNIINDPKIQELIEKNSDVYTEKNRVVVKYNNLKYIVVFKTS